MIAEALNAITQMAVTAAGPRLIREDSREAKYLIGGELTTFEKEHPARDHEAKSLDDVVRLARRFHESEDSPVVWYDFDAVRLVINDAGHRDETATLNLIPTDVFCRVVGLRTQPQWYELKPFVRMLRIELAGTLEPSELLEKVRRLKFENGSITTAEVARNRESLGREITSRVDGTAEIPEEVTLRVRVWSNLGEDERFGVRCAVETDPAMGKLQLIPLPDEIERVKNLAIVGLAGRLSDGLGDVPSYFGRP